MHAPDDSTALQSAPSESRGFVRFGFGVPWEETANYSQAVRAGDLLFVSGQLSHDLDGTFVGEGDIAVQAETTFANLDHVLDAYGARRIDVAEINIFVVDLRGNFAAVGEACRTYFGAYRPAANAFGVVELALPQQLLEIAATVVLTRPEAER